MNKKAGFELGINFIVIIIISIVLFGMGIMLIQKLWVTSDEIKTNMEKSMQDKLANALDRGALVSSYPSKFTADKGKTVYLGVGVRNERGENEFFSIEVEKDTHHSPPNCDEIIPVFMRDAFNINNNDKQYRLIAITMPRNCDRGVHIFNIYVCWGSSGCYYDHPNRYGDLQKIFITLR